MKCFRYSSPVFFLAVLVIVFSSGCVGTTTQKEPSPEEIFDTSVRKLVSDLISQQTHTPAEMAPAAVMSGSLKTGSSYTRLEEYIMEQLSLELRKSHNIHKLSRQNWFEYREGRPLSFNGLPAKQRELIESLIVYEVGVSRDEVLKKLKVHIVASDANGRSVPGLVSNTDLDFEPGLPAQRLYVAMPDKNPFPEGLEERPYRSIDRLAYSLSAELADAYRAGISADDQVPKDSEVRVLLYTNPTRAVSSGLIQRMQDNLQQAIINIRGFSCAISKKDFGPAFHQIDFYKKRESIFEMEESRLTAGTVLLMTDVFRHQQGDKIGLAVRAVWRVTPLETESQELIRTNVAGTYLSGFTAKAYLDRRAVKVAYKRVKPVPIPKTPGYKPAPVEKEKPEPPKYEYTGPPQDLDVCFYKFNEVYEKRIYPVLSNAPGITDILKSDEMCEELKPCLCYQLVYEGNMETLSAWLTENLRTSTVLPFKLKPKGEGRLEVHFTTGFE